MDGNRCENFPVHLLMCGNSHAGIAAAGIPWDSLCLRTLPALVLFVWAKRTQSDSFTMFSSEHLWTLCNCETDANAVLMQWVHLYSFQRDTCLHEMWIYDECWILTRVFGLKHNDLLSLQHRGKLD